MMHVLWMLNIIYFQSREVRRARSFNVHAGKTAQSENGVSPSTSPSVTSPLDSPGTLRKRYKPLVVKKIAAQDLEEKQTISGFLERKGFSAQWMRWENMVLVICIDFSYISFGVKLFCYHMGASFQAYAWSTGFFVTNATMFYY